MLKLLFISCLLGLFVVSCDDGTQKKTEITQALCEALPNRTDCEAAGCTYTCGMVLTEEDLMSPDRHCLARRHVGVCMALVPASEGNDNMEEDVSWDIHPGERVWIRREVRSTPTPYTFYEYVHFLNETDQPLEAPGLATLAADPCLNDDPDETLFPWEGSCETDWWSDTMWDDVLPH